VIWLDLPYWGIEVTIVVTKVSYDVDSVSDLKAFEVLEAGVDSVVPFEEVLLVPAGAIGVLWAKVPVDVVFSPVETIVDLDFKTETELDGNKDEPEGDEPDGVITLEMLVVFEFSPVETMEEAVVDSVVVGEPDLIVEIPDGPVELAAVNGQYVV